MRVRSSEQEDHLLRIIREAAEALRRLREMLLGSSESREAVRAQVSATTDRLLGSEAPLLRQLDADTAVRLLNDRQRLALWVEALELEADALARDEPEHAQVVRSRAAALRSAGARMETPGMAEGL